jgi:hypothetical protein
LESSAALGLCQNREDTLPADPFQFPLPPNNLSVQSNNSLSGFSLSTDVSCRYYFLQCSTDRAPVNFLLVLQIDSLPLTFFSPLLATLCTQRPFTANWVSPIRKDAFCCPCLLLGGICIAKAQSCGWANSDQVSLKVSRYMRSTLSV